MPCHRNTIFLLTILALTPSYVPFGLLSLFRAIWYFSHYRNHEFWWKMFTEGGNPKKPYTVETLIIGERIIFTADEENIKAILATQFQDYGKGKQFQKEWDDFLGHSKSLLVERVRGRLQVLTVRRYLHHRWRAVA